MTWVLQRKHIMGTFPVSS